MMRNDDAVSPVIGVILMVAITVILAAVIAVFVFDLAGDVQSGKTVGVTAKLNGENATVTYMGGTDHATLVSLNMSLYDAGVVFINATEVASPTVGQKILVLTNSSKTPSSIVVTGKFSDGTEVPLLDKTL
jgi:archaeal type IV pilus assembly protein PilA